ncbi:MAG: N-6 DNA methylase [Cyanobacteria bacterium P01_A01_bin.135]
MPDPAPEISLDRLHRWWMAIAPACIADLTVSIDLWRLLQRAWSRGAALPQLPIVVGQTYEADLAATVTRKRQGSYYTPAAIAQFVVEATVTSACGEATPPTILDPACGGGIFLVVAYRALVRQYKPSRPDGYIALLEQLHGVDVDPNAVAVTRLALCLAAIEAVCLTNLTRKSPPNLLHEDWQSAPLQGTSGNLSSRLSQTIRCASTLLFAGDTFPSNASEAAFPSNAQFDVVLGNPPYVDAETMTRCSPALRHYCRSRYQTARGNWDLFCVFIERALQLCRAGGWHSFVVPNKLASADYAAPARSLLSRYQLHQLRDYSQVKAFSAAVYPLVYVLRAEAAIAGSVTYTVMDTPEQSRENYRLCRSRFALDRPWCLSPQQGWLTRLQQYPKLGDVLTVTGAMTVAEAYRLKPLIYDSPHPTEAFPLVNSGTIDRYTHHWGKKPLRYLGDRYQYPVVSRTQLAAALPKRYQQATTPKIIIAGLTHQLECIWDPEGTLLAGKSTTVILLPPPVAHLGPVLRGLLNSRLMTDYFRALFGY